MIVAEENLDTAAIGAATTMRICASKSSLRPSARRICCAFRTAGSVDDGKSTLIGRLLYDSQSSTKTRCAR